MKRQKPRRRLTIGRIVTLTLYIYLGIGFCMMVWVVAKDIWHWKTQEQAEILQSKAKYVYYTADRYLEEDGTEPLSTCSGRIGNGGEDGSFAAFLERDMQSDPYYYVLVCEDGVPLYALCSRRPITDYQKPGWDALIRLCRDPFRRSEAVAAYPD